MTSTGRQIRVPREASYPHGALRGRSRGRWRGRLAALAVLLPALVVGPLGGPAAAQESHGLVERAVYEDRFDSGYDEPDPYWLERCGTRTRFVGAVVVVESVFFDGTVVLRIDEQYHWYDFDSGAPLLSQKDREILALDPVSTTVDEQAGTRTVVLDVDYLGIPLRLKRPGAGVVLQSAGLLERAATLVFDLETGDLLSEDLVVTQVAGPKPFLDPSGALDFEALEAFVCEQLTL